jgi:4,5-dihydroxyphthalate decarboxylase
MSEPLTMAIQRFDRTAALHTGGAPVKGVTVLHVPPGLVGVDGVIQGIFDAAEMPLAHYVFLKDQGEPFTAIPVFPDRLFIQQYVYTRPDTGIRSPADLRGRRVLIPLYYMTASFWHRGMLKEDYGILPHEVEWFTTSPERDPRMRIPDGVKVTLRAGPHFGFERLLDGTVDALLTEATPVLDDGARANIVRVHRDADRLQREYWARTGVHIIVHLIVIRLAAVQARPSLPEELCEAFDRAKAIAYRTLEDERMTSLPLMRSYLDETVAMFGDDPWPYGVERNRNALDRFLCYAHEQGFTRQRLTPESLFDNPARDFPFRSRITAWLA